MWRIPLLLDMAPDVFDHQTYLYIGARDDTFNLSEQLRQKSVSVLEVYDDYIVRLRESDWLDVIKGDIRLWETDRQWDVVIWWHGPEHIPEQDLDVLIPKIETFATKIAVMAGPWGHTTVRTNHKNPYEFHFSVLTPERFAKHGYTVRTVGQKDTFESQLCAVKKCG